MTMMFRRSFLVWVTALKNLAENYKAKKGEDPRIAYYRKMTGKEE